MIKPAIQGGGPNYLGKQKMVTAPKKWLSSPDHEPAELAYITEKEKDILIDLDLYGSLNGKPNRGPAGIMSLQGDMGSIGGGRSSGGGGGGGGGGGYQDRIQQIAAAQARAAAANRAAEQQAAAQRDMQATIAQAEKAKLAVEPTRPEAGFKQSVIDIGFQEALKKTEDARRREEEFKDTGDYDVFADTTLLSGPQVDIRDIKGEVTDPGSVSYDPTIEQQKTILEDPRVDEGFKRYIRQVQQPTVSTDRTGLMQSFMDTSPKIDVKDAIGRGVFNVGLKKLGLGMLNPFLGLASLFTRGKTPRSAYDLAKNLKSNIRTPSSNIIDKRTSAIDTKPDREGGDGQRVKTVAERVTTGQGLESGAKLLGVDYLRQKEEARRRGKIIADILNKNSYQGKDLTSKQRNDLINYIEQINKFLVPTTQGA